MTHIFCVHRNSPLCQHVSSNKWWLATASTSTGHHRKAYWNLAQRKLGYFKTWLALLLKCWIIFFERHIIYFRLKIVSMIFTMFGLWPHRPSCIECEKHFIYITFIGTLLLCFFTNAFIILSVLNVKWWVTIKQETYLIILCVCIYYIIDFVWSLSF